jgi:hypothetical protein
MLQHYELDDAGRTSYGGYEGNQVALPTSVEMSSERLFADTSREKIAPVPQSHQNLLRSAIAAMSMLTLIALTVICLLFIGGVGGWISFLVASCVVLGVAITTTNGNK